MLRMVPADILEECEEAVAATLSKRDRSDPDAATKRIVDGFAKLGIQPSQLETLLGHRGDPNLAGKPAVFRAVAGRCFRSRRKDCCRADGCHGLEKSASAPSFHRVFPPLDMGRRFRFPITIQPLAFRTQGNAFFREA